MPGNKPGRSALTGREGIKVSVVHPAVGWVLRIRCTAELLVKSL